MKEKLDNHIYCIIYAVKNDVNNQIYIGQTWQTLERRFYEHTNQRKCLKLFNAVQKYGKDNFSIRPLMFCHTQEIADYWESYFIDQYDSINSGYNIREGGSKGRHSKESREKLSLAHLGKRTSPATEFQKGEKHHSAKLTYEIVKEIRALSDPKVTELAAKYGVSSGTITNVLKNKYWK